MIKNNHPYFFKKNIVRSIGTVVCVFVICFIAYAFTSGPNNGSTLGTSSYGTNNSWSNTSNASSSDDSYATVSVNDGESSEYLTITNFGFGIPSGATIDGIEVFIEKHGQSSKIKDASVKLIQGGVISGTDHVLSPSWGSSDFTDTYGTSTDLWGLTLTDVDINASDFGVAFAIEKSSNGGGNKTASIDDIIITVNYTIATLPIQLTSFTATPVDNKKIKLEWATGSEKNSGNFVTERSENGATFEKIATVKAAGNSTTSLYYSTYDKNPLLGNAYYRLKQIDIDGKYIYSDMISLAVHVSSSTTKCKFKVRPNPCPRQCNISVTDCDDQDIAVAMVDALGNEVYSKIPITGNGNSFSLDANNNLAPGVYIVMGSSKNQSFNQKIVVQ